ncbi:BRD4-interacting chromatin-remodeling complex-associated protein isoform X3 [Moschus berezovskii]|uniref:BRD4-interacting chromatin-remodeling complex-associated protein isoform X3 n=1 Tax=Moschus berezovskii TaxID=68408 RepID=UPI0024442A5C|nr:BRD4-interacting chromatin-remodeling complex-associated protein isoform X3 [Moschus berezovskii]
MRGTTASALALTPLRRWGAAGPTSRDSLGINRVRRVTHSARAHVWSGVTQSGLTSSSSPMLGAQREEEKAAVSLVRAADGAGSCPAAPACPQTPGDWAPRERSSQGGPGLLPPLTCRPLPAPPRPVAMDDEDGRCLLDVICDPQALNDFLHGSEKLDSDDLLDNPGEAQSAFYEGPGLHVQEASGNHLNPEPSQPAPSVDLDFLEDDILDSPAAGGGSGGAGGAEQPCDILQQSLQEANITEQTLEAEAELDLGPFQLPTLQPADGGAGPAGAGGAAAVATGPQALFSGGADLLGLQAPPTVLTHQALVPPQDVVSKALSVQPFLQPVGLGNVTLQPIPGLQGLPNGSPGGATAATLGLAPIQVVGQPVMALNPPTSQLLAKQVPVSGYLASAAGPSEPVTLASAGVSPQGAGLVLQKNLPAAVATTLNGNSVFGGAGATPAPASGTPSGQPLAVAPGLGTSPLVQAPNVILHRTPTPIQPKPAGVLPPKLYQLTPKPFAPAGATLTIQGEAGGLPQQPKAPQNLTFMAAGKAGQNVVLSGFPAPALQANVFKPPPATTTGAAPPQPPGTLSKPMSVHLLNQGSSIVIPAQHMLPGQNQFLLPGTSAVQLPQPLSALPANVGGQILAAAAPHAGGQLIANPILTNQNLAGPLSLGPVLAPHSGAHSAAHILSAAPIQVGQPALFQMPVSLAAGSLPTQSQPAAAGPAATTVLQGVTLPPSAVAMLNTPDGLVQPATPAAGGEAAPVLTVQTAPQAPPAVSTPLPLGLQQQQQPPPPPQAPTPQAAAPAQATTPQPSPGLASSPEKIVLGQPPSAAPTAVLTQDSLQMFLPQERSQQPLSTEGPHLSVPASVIVSAPPPAQDPAPTTPVAKGAGLGPQAPDSQASPAPAPQMVTTPFPALPQPKALLERFHQVPSGIILQSKAVGAPAAPQSSASLGPLASPTASVLVSGQAPSGTPTTSSHPPTPAPLATAGLPPLLPAESKAFASNLPTLTVAKAAPSGPGKSTGLQYESKLGGLKKPPALQPSKEACFLEHLHKHQGSVLHPDYKTAFPSFEDALHRLLPYHVYQGALPSPSDYHKVDEEFETVSTQLLKRTQAMLNKYRLLLLEESRRVSPSAEMVMIDRMFIQEEKTTLALDKQLAKEKPDEYVSSSRSLGLPVAASSEGHRLPGHGPSPSSASGAPAQPPLHLPTKLVIRHGGAGGSPSVTWARASSSSLSSSSSSSAASSLDADEDGPMPSRNRPPIKTYEARSRIGLKLKIKQEAGLSKVVHNTALDPVHQTPPPPPASLKAAEPPPRPPPPPPAPGQMNGTVDHPPPPAAADRKPPPPTPHCPRLPLRKTYRENVEAPGVGATEGAAATAVGRARGGSPAPLPTKVDEATSGLIRELAAVEDELYQRMLKAGPAEPAAGTGQGSGSREPGWEAPPLPPAKRRKSESPDVDQASFSSDSPQDDTLTEHLQSAIDSILNLQQAPGRTPAPPYPHATPAAVTPTSPTPLHRPEAYPPSSHNGGLGTRTLNR